MVDDLFLVSSRIVFFLWSFLLRCLEAPILELEILRRRVTEFSKVGNLDWMPFIIICGRRGAYL